MKHQSNWLLAGLLFTLVAAAPPPPEQLVAQQRAAMAKFDRFDGAWRGEAVTQTATGEHRVTQTERFGSFLDGSLKLVEGHGFNADGSTGFHAFGVIAWNAASATYEFRSHAQGLAGSFPITPTADGYVWSIPAGPATIRYTASIGADGVWTEVGDRIVPGQPDQRFFRMVLRRIGNTDWPEAGAIGPR
jgi:hypothetical protein